MDWDVFWSVLFVMFIVIPVFMVWIFAIADLFMRPDLRGISKVLWLFGIILFPFLGTILYFLTRPAQPMAREAANVEDSLSRLEMLHDSGKISDAEYQQQRTRVLMAT